MKSSNNTFKVIGFSLLASVVGAGIGILLAPHKGSKTRNKLIRGAKEMAENIQDKIKDEAGVLSSKASKLEDQAKAGLKEKIKSIKHTANELLHY